MHTLKKFTKEESSGTSATLDAVEDEGSKGPSITAIVGTASSSSNSLHQNNTYINFPKTDSKLMLIFDNRELLVLPQSQIDSPTLNLACF